MPAPIVVGRFKTLRPEQTAARLRALKPLKQSSSLLSRVLWPLRGMFSEFFPAFKHHTR